MLADRAGIGDKDVARRAFSPSDVRNAALRVWQFRFCSRERSDRIFVVIPLETTMRDAERAAILRALRYAKGNRALAARLLGVGRATLYTKLEELGLGRSAS